MSRDLLVFVVLATALGIGIAWATAKRDAAMQHCVAAGNSVDACEILLD